MTSNPRAGAWAGVLGPIAYVATWVAAGLVTPGYDPVAQAISELAAVGAPTRWLMTAAFVTFGLASLPFAAAVRQLVPGDTRPLRIALVTCGLATVSAGGLACTAGCPGPDSSLLDLGHSVAAVVGYSALAAAPFMLARAVRRSDEPTWQRAAQASIVLGVVAVVAMAIWVAGLAGDAGGAWQRGFNTLLDIWWSGLGVLLLVRLRTSEPAPA